MSEAVPLDLIESFLKLRLRAACIDSLSEYTPTNFVSRPSIVSVPLRSSLLYEPYHQLLNLSYDSSTKNPRCWNVVYKKRAADWEFVSFSTSFKGFVVRVELHKLPPPNEAEAVVVYCEPRVALEREKFLIHEILRTGKFISDFIFPAIEEELKDSKILPYEDVSRAN
ncbi:expressed conserved protein [Echinococcus multilocularis]|uniref:Expressed conserved protein n=1 Tax=Echinococcus multilocularis TaxID=6211 RepID=A0A068Y1K1_ECHMU|nr:expressed conserved protein [Echinococcus multilocularis]